MTFRVSDLTPTHIDELSALVAGDGDYTMRVFGRPPSVDDARSILQALPPGIGPEAKSTLGLWEDDQLIAVADTVRGYPRHEVVYVGLLQVGPEWQGRGAGRTVHDAIVDRARKAPGITTLRLSIVATNADMAEGFWRHLGYQPTREVREWVREDGLATTSHVYERSL